MNEIQVQIPEYRIRQAPVGAWKVGEATRKPTWWVRFWTKLLLGWEWMDY